MVVEVLLGSVLGLSLVLNLFQFSKSKKQLKKPAPNYGAKEVLKALFSGDAILQIKIIDPADFMLISPKDRNL